MQPIEQGPVRLLSKVPVEARTRGKTHLVVSLSRM